MLLDLNKIPEVYIVCGYTDPRKAIDGFTSIIQDKFEQQYKEDKIPYGERKERCLIDEKPILDVFLVTLNLIQLKFYLKVN